MPRTSATITTRKKHAHAKPWAWHSGRAFNVKRMNGIRATRGWDLPEKNRQVVGMGELSSFYIFVVPGEFAITLNVDTLHPAGCVRTRRVSPRAVALHLVQTPIERAAPPRPPARSIAKSTAVSDAFHQIPLLVEFYEQYL